MIYWLIKTTKTRDADRGRKQQAVLMECDDAVCWLLWTVVAEIWWLRVNWACHVVRWNDAMTLRRLWCPIFSAVMTKWRNSWRHHIWSVRYFSRRRRVPVRTRSKHLPLRRHWALPSPGPTTNAPRMVWGLSWVVRECLNSFSSRQLSSRVLRAMLSAGSRLTRWTPWSVCHLTTQWILVDAQATLPMVGTRRLTANTADRSFAFQVQR